MNLWQALPLLVSLMSGLAMAALPQTRKANRGPSSTGSRKSTKALLPAVPTELYIGDGETIIPLRFPPSETLTLHDVQLMLMAYNLNLDDLSYLHFNSVTDVRTVLHLPLAIFEEYMSPAQLVEMILNDNLASLFAVNWKRKLKTLFKDRKRMKEKVRTIRKKIEILDMNNLGPYHDEVVRRLPIKLYKYIHPFVALASTSFEMTSDNLLRLFGFTRRTFSALEEHVQDLVGKAMEAITALKENDRVIRAVEILTPIVKRIPDVAFFALKVGLITLQVLMMLGVIALKSDAASTFDPLSLIEDRGLELAEVVNNKVDDPLEASYSDIDFDKEFSQAEDDLSFSSDIYSNDDQGIQKVSVSQNVASSDSSFDSAEYSSSISQASSDEEPLEILQPSTEKTTRIMPQTKEVKLNKASATTEAFLKAFDSPNRAGKGLAKGKNPLSTAAGDAKEMKYEELKKMDIKGPSKFVITVNL